MQYCEFSDGKNDNFQVKTIHILTYNVSSNVSGENRDVEKGVRHFAKGVI